MVPSSVAIALTAEILSSNFFLMTDVCVDREFGVYSERVSKSDSTVMKS